MAKRLFSSISYCVISMGQQMETSEIGEQFHVGFVQNQIITRAFGRGKLFDFGQNAGEVIL